ncbi:hypothetical protein Pla175_37990 [Pirellulimonas nuda]|uniref:Uncharacterized protein n=1 Tax=Pirellulimonas nuda TaxID=2528009 RepID=A0A518DFY6_9BACT|nr:hypothetical protein [Pirellulimonas nuda]QDU90395.1 hypothetical protein Pla175_37990 [Pirellulimonas nuda]
MSSPHSFGPEGASFETFEMPPTPEPTPTPSAPPGDPPRASFLEMVLDPRSLAALMAAGAGLLTLGLIAWLWSQGVFDDAEVVAWCLGTANLTLIAAGVATASRSRFATAGRALTLLGCVVMPLNLWFYDAQGLVTLAGGGNLWVAALACCVVYAVCAWLLRDPWLVYASVGGVAMTGMLFLADADIARFWEIVAPSTLLVVLGAVCIHAERLFPAAPGPYSRERFGTAFFRAGHIVMASGLVVLLTGCVTGWAYDSYFVGWDFARPDVASVAQARLAALALVVLGAYSYGYSQVVAPRGRAFAKAAVLMLLWGEVLLLDWMGLPILGEEQVALLSLLLLVLAIVCRVLKRGATTIAEVAPVATAPLLIAATGLAVSSSDPNHGLLVAAGASLAVASGLAGAASGRRAPVAMAALAACMATWQSLCWLGMTTYAPLLAASLVGAAVLAARGMGVMSRGGEVAERGADWAGGALLMLAGVGGVLLALGRLLVGETQWDLAGLMAAQGAIAGASVLAARQPSLRRVLGSLAAVQVVTAALVANSLSLLDGWQRAELLITASGLALVGSALVGWRRERSGAHDPWVDVCFAVGSLLASLAPVAGLLDVRFFGDAFWAWRMLHETGVLAVGLGLLAAGVLSRVRSTTFAGAGMLAVYVVSLVGLIHVPEELQSTAVYLMVGGGAFFASAVLLSVYRDRLLSLPQRMKEGEGVYRVLKWR